MRVLLFAGLAERVGRREVDLDDLPSESSVADLDRALRAALTPLAGATYRIAVNQRYARPDDPVRAGDEIALIPPVSGGAR